MDASLSLGESGNANQALNPAHLEFGWGGTCVK